MTSLRDIRLWLIIALAVLCLIALRNCTIDYTNTSDNSAAVDTRSSTEGKDVAGVDSDAEKSTDQTADAAAEPAENKETIAADNAAGGTEEAATEANQLVSQVDKSQVDKSQVDKSEGDAADTGATTAADSSGTEGGEVADAASDATSATAKESDENQDTAGSETESADAGTEAEASASTATTDAAADASEDASQAKETTSGTVTNIKVIKREIVEFKLGDPANSGVFGDDLTADIATVREGLGDYNGRIESLKAFIEEFRANK